MMNNSQSHFDGLPEDVRDYAARLDNLAALDRTGAPGLEDRIFAATRESLPGTGAGGAAVRVIGGAGAEHQERASYRLWTPMRLAAAVAICGGGAAIWLATLTTPAPTGGTSNANVVGGMQARADADLDYLVALAGLDDGWGRMSEQLDYLKLETDAVAGSLLWDMAWGGLLLSEGAM